VAASHRQTLDEALLRGEPYFGGDLAAYQGGIDRKMCLIALLNRVIDESGGRPVRVLEVGSWAGGSAVTWALGIKRRGVPGSVLCVDHWQPYFDLSMNTAAHYAEMKRAAATGDIYRLFLHNLRAMGVDDIVDHVKGRAEDILPTLESNGYDLVFLDGSHSYEAVRTDISNAKRLLREGGILCGDDLELRQNEVDQPEHRLAIANNVDFTANSRTGISYHPGVTEAVAEAFGDVSEQHGVWCVAKCQDVWKPVEFQPNVDDVPQPLIDLKPPEDERTPQLVADFKSFNIVRRGQTYLG
jgi:predicted O-methyltransferase YrrM